MLIGCPQVLFDWPSSFSISCLRFWLLGFTQQSWALKLEKGHWRWLWEPQVHEHIEAQCKQWKDCTTSQTTRPVRPCCPLCGKVWDSSTGFIRSNRTQAKQIILNPERLPLKKKVRNAIDRSSWRLWSREVTSCFHQDNNDLGFSETEKRKIRQCQIWY